MSLGVEPGKYVVVRTYSAGVYCGVLEYQLGREVVLTEARLIHSWKGAKTTLDIATTGVKEANISAAAKRVVLTEVIGLIEATDVAAKCLHALRT